MNTPLNAAPISGRDGLPQPSVATIGEAEEEEVGGEEGGNPASVLARVSLILVVTSRVHRLTDSFACHLEPCSS